MLLTYNPALVLIRKENFIDTMDNALLKNRDAASPHQVQQIWDDFQNTKISDYSWDSINWEKALKEIEILRSRIYANTKKASSSNDPSDWKNVRELQKTMIGSYNNVLVSVRRVSQLNKGKYTPGLDEFVVTSKEQRFRLVEIIHNRVNIYQWVPLPVSRVYIPKPNGKFRPLGIPTITDRIIQAIIKNALEPQYEFLADVGSYGFRPGRSCHDAIEKLHTTLSSSKPNNQLPRKAWVLDADIQGCFDNISHDYLEKVLKGFPASPLISRWLQAGYVDKTAFHQTDSGTPQGGIISPLLSNIALDGLEKDLDINYRRKKSKTALSGYRLVLDDYVPKGVHPARAFVRYADDFVVLCETEKDCLDAKRHLEGCLLRRGLKFSPDKVKISHIEQGFDFLGTTLKYFKANINTPGDRDETNVGYKLLIRPSLKSNIKHRQKLKDLFIEHHGKSVDSLIKSINPVIRGWANYHRKFSSRKTFERMDFYLYVLQRRFSNRAHPNKSFSWKTGKYFSALNPARPLDKWVFGNTQTRNYMLKHRWVSIQRHDIVPNAYSKDDPSLREFWEKRAMSGKNTNIVLHKSLGIAKKQRHLCVLCFQPLMNYEPLEVHHIIPRRLNGPDTEGNKVILHNMCHQGIRKMDGKPETADRIRSNLATIKAKSYRHKTMNN